MILPRGDDPRFADVLLDACARLGAGVAGPDRRHRAAAARAASGSATRPPGIELVVASVATLEVCLDKWALAERCRGRVRVPETRVADAAFDAARRSSCR